MKQKLLMLCMLLCIMAGASYAQNQTASGIVYSAEDGLQNKMQCCITWYDCYRCSCVKYA